MSRISIVLGLYSLQKCLHLSFFKPSWEADPCEVCMVALQTHWRWAGRCGCEVLHIRRRGTGQCWAPYKSSGPLYMPPPHRHLAALHLSHRQPADDVLVRTFNSVTIFVSVYKCLPLGKPERCWKPPKNVRNWIEYISHRFPLCPVLFFQWLQRWSPEARFTILMLSMALSSP